MEAENLTPTPRVLHLDSSTSWGGGQNQVRLLMQHLHRANVQQLCFCPTGSPLAERLRALGLPVKAISWRGGSDARAAWHVFRELRNNTIVHCHDAHALQVALLPARLRGAKVIAARRVPFKTNALKWNRADVVVAVSEHVRHRLIGSGVNPHRIRVIHSGTDAGETRDVEPLVPSMRNRYGVPANAFVVANAALFVRMKGQLIVPPTAALLPEVHWFLAGDGPLRGELEAAIAQHNVAGRVHLLGWLPDARRLLKEVDAYLSASTDDGLGNSVTESLALHVPVLSADGGGGAEIMGPVHEQTNGVLYDADNAEALAAAIRRLHDPAIRAQVIAAQDARFPDFDIARTAAQTLDLYQEVVRG